MNRQTRRRNKKEVRENAVERSCELKELSRDEWYLQINRIPEYLEKIFLSRLFLVQIYIEPGKPDRLSICRNGIDKYGNWLENITWEELQEIKNSVGYADQDCIEIYPKKDDIVNVANMRHLWAVDQVDFTWR